VPLEVLIDWLEAWHVFYFRCQCIIP